MKNDKKNELMANRKKNISTQDTMILPIVIIVIKITLVDLVQVLDGVMDIEYFYQNKINVKLQLYNMMILMVLVTKNLTL